MRYNHPNLRLCEIQQSDSSFKFCQNISPVFCLSVNQTHRISIEPFMNLFCQFGNDMQKNINFCNFSVSTLYQHDILIEVKCAPKETHTL